MLVNHVSSVKDKAKANLKSSNLLSELDGMKPNEIDDWVNENVTSVNDIKEFLTLLVVAIQALGLNK